MGILLSTASFVFSSFSDVSIHKEIVQKIFTEEFPKITFVNVPEPAPVEIPRFILASHHGFSTVVITSNLIQLTTKFNENFSCDWKNKCKPYLEKKLELIYKFLKESGIKIKYSGLTVNFTVETQKNSVEIIENKFIKQKMIPNLNLYDIMQKQTFEYKDKFFINFQIQNQRYQNVDIANLNKNMLHGANENSIAFIVDINDRKIANQEIEYVSSKAIFDEILGINDCIMAFGVENIIIGEKALCLN